MAGVKTESQRPSQLAQKYMKLIGKGYFVIMNAILQAQRHTDRIGDISYLFQRPQGCIQMSFRIATALFHQFRLQILILIGTFQTSVIQRP